MPQSIITAHPWFDWCPIIVIGFFCELCRIFLCLRNLRADVWQWIAELVVSELDRAASPGPMEVVTHIFLRAWPRDPRPCRPLTDETIKRSPVTVSLDPVRPAITVLLPWMTAPSRLAVSDGRNRPRIIGHKSAPGSEQRRAARLRTSPTISRSSYSGAD